MNLRAVDAVFPVREKSVNRIKILNESSPKDAEELRYIDAVRAKRELGSENYKIKPIGRRRILEQSTRFFLMGQNL